jgi:hypothetical protein
MARSARAEPPVLALPALSSATAGALSGSSAVKLDSRLSREAKKPAGRRTARSESNTAQL